MPYKGYLICIHGIGDCTVEYRGRVHNDVYFQGTLSDCKTWIDLKVWQDS